MPEVLEKALGGKPEDGTPIMKSDYTDDFKFGEVWVAVKEDTLFKFDVSDKNNTEVKTFSLVKGDEMFVDITA
ncbi:MAG: hypothetical protein J6C24_03770, partial [Clostridia bacterium]|nr:hypothetical protein [Clostridia bacterium]